MLRLLRLRRAGGCCRRLSRRRRLRGGRCRCARGLRARTLGIAMREMRRHRRAGDVDRVRLSGARVVADVDLLLSLTLAFRGRGGLLVCRRATGRAGRLTAGRRRAGGLLELVIAVLVALGVVVVSEVTGRRAQGGGCSRSGVVRRRCARRRLRGGDLGEADSCGCRERQPDDGSDERTAPESAESVPHNAFPSLGGSGLTPLSRRLEAKLAARFAGR